MKKVLACLVFSFLVSIHVASAQTTAVPSSQDTVATLLAKLTLLQAQLSLLENTDLNSNSAEWLFDYSKANLKLGIDVTDIEYDSDDRVNLFLVRNNRLYEDNKWTKNIDTDDYKIWNIFAAFAGDDFVDAYIDQYATYRITDTGILGFVQLVSREGPQWGLAINANASDLSSEKWTKDLVGVLIHEYAHILTLNDNEVNHREKYKSSCNGTYLTSVGCSEQKSYINTFVHEFWDGDDFGYSGSYEKYYAKNQDRFITKYAPKSPEEDIAESFAQFILFERPLGTTEKDLKVAFFYRYPELVALRTEIRDSVEEYFVN